jgi:hypothetical protein
VPGTGFAGIGVSVGCHATSEKISGGESAGLSPNITSRNSKCSTCRPSTTRQTVFECACLERLADHDDVYRSTIGMALGLLFALSDVLDDAARATSLIASITAPVAV